MNTEKKQEPANSDIMTKLVKIEEEIKKAEKRLYQKITWTIVAMVAMFALGVWSAF